VVPEEGNSEGELLRLADEALYVSKADGRNTFSVAPGAEGAAGG